MKTVPVSDDLIIRALKKSGGTIVAAARSLKIDPSTIHRRVNSNRRVKQTLNEEREYTIDIAEMQLRNAVNRGEAWAVCFTLKCLGKQRGFVERMEHSVPDGQAVQIEEQIQEKANLFMQKMNKLIEDRGQVIDLKVHGDRQ